MSTLTSDASDRITLRFKRAVQFPRFSMDAGEIWDCLPYSKTGREYLDALRTGSDRFPFAGGLCLIQDVEVIAP